MRAAGRPRRTGRNVRGICDKIIGQLRAQQSGEAFGRQDLIEKVLSMAEKFFLRSCKTDSEECEVTFEWYVFVLVRLLQAAHGEQRDTILIKIKRTLSQNNGKINGTETEIENRMQTAQTKPNDAITVGTKLTGILRKLVFNNLTDVPIKNNNQVRY